MKKSCPPSDVLQLLREFVSYDPLTGAMHWIKSPGNSIRAGRAITVKNSHGYVHFTFRGVCFNAHSAIWYMQTGAWPEEIVDHINLDRGDNRWANLRAATYAQNEHNKRKKPWSVAKGVRRDGNRWRAEISANGKKHHLGNFHTVEAAQAAYAAAAHRLHGEFARVA